MKILQNLMLSKMKSELDHDKLINYSPEQIYKLFDKYISAAINKPNSGMKELELGTEEIEKYTKEMNLDKEALIVNYMRNSLEGFRCYYCDFESGSDFLKLSFDSLIIVLPFHICMYCGSYYTARRVISLGVAIGKTAIEQVYPNESDESEKERLCEFLLAYFVFSEDFIESVNDYKIALEDDDKRKELLLSAMRVMSAQKILLES